MLKNRKKYAILFALWIFVAGAFSPLVVSKFSPSINYAQAQNDQTTYTDFNSSNGLGSEGLPTPSCLSIGGGTITGCFALFIYYVPYYLSHVLVGLTAQFFDWTLFHSIDNTLYQVPFVTDGWALVRDLSNMAFIFVLLYIAIQMILGIGHDAKKSIATLIIVALFINFSMFFSKVIIDGGNILGHAFYNSINVDSLSQDINNDGKKSLSEAVIQKINPQQFLTKETLNLQRNPLTAKEAWKCMGYSILANIGIVDQTTVAMCIAENSINADTGSGYVWDDSAAGWFILVTLLATIANIVLIGTFFSIGFLFLGRIIGLMFAIIISPLAFISKIVPGLENMQYVGFDKWIKDLIGLSFLPGVFMFFLYLILKFTSPISTTGLNGFDKLVVIILPLAFIITLLIISKKVAKSLAGEIGGMIGGFIQKGAMIAGGAALGIAAGGAGMLARGTAGRAGRFFSEKEGLKNAAAGKTKLFSETSTFGRLGNSVFQKGAKTVLTGTRGAAKGSMDVRNTGAANMLSKYTGMDMNKNLGLVGLGAEAGVGGYFGKQQKKIEKERKFAESLGADHHLSEKLNDAVEEADGKIKTAKEAVQPENEKLAELNRAVERAKIAGGKDYQDDPAYKAAKLAAVDQEKVRDDKQKNVTSAEKEKTDLEKYKKGAEEDRKKTYLDSVRRQSGKKFAENERQTFSVDGHNYSYLKKYGKEIGEDGARQFFKEMGEGFLKGAAVGGTVGMFAGPATAAVGALGGGIIKGLQQSLMNYSGTTNRGVVDEHFKPEAFTSSKYKGGTPSAPAAPSGGGGGGHGPTPAGAGGGAHH